MLSQAAVNAIVDTLPIEYRGSDPVRYAGCRKVPCLPRTDRAANDGTRAQPPYGQPAGSEKYAFSLNVCRAVHLANSLFLVAEIVKPLGLPQAKVNKCLIALVGKKAVTKTAVGVSRLALGLRCATDQWRREWRFMRSYR
jgi:hypothetical protein